MAYKTVKKPGLGSKVYEVTFDAISLVVFEAKKLETIEELKSKITNDESLQKAISEVENEQVPQMTLKAEIQEPQFKELALGLGALMTLSGQMDFASAGKVIFDTCCVFYDQEFDNQPRALIKLCMELATDYVLPISADIKKN